MFQKRTPKRTTKRLTQRLTFLQEQHIQDNSTEEDRMRYSTSTTCLQITITQLVITLPYMVKFTITVTVITFTTENTATTKILQMQSTSNPIVVVYLEESLDYAAAAAALL